MRQNHRCWCQRAMCWLRSGPITGQWKT
jgi:hypothetical protein